MTDTHTFNRANGKTIAGLVTGGSRIVDATMCIYFGGFFWDLCGCNRICTGDRVSIPAQSLGRWLLINFSDAGILRSYAVPKLGAAASASPQSPAQSLPAQPQPGQTTAAAASPCESQQSTSASPRRLRNQGRTGPKPSRPVHSGSVKLKGRAYRFSVSDFNAQSLATRKAF